jgi:hypothetical protein
LWEEAIFFLRHGKPRCTNPPSSLCSSMTPQPRRPRCQAWGCAPASPVQAGSTVWQAGCCGAMAASASGREAEKARYKRRWAFSLRHHGRRFCTPVTSFKDTASRIASLMPRLAWGDDPSLERAVGNRLSSRRAQGCTHPRRQNVFSLPDIHPTGPVNETGWVICSEIQSADRISGFNPSSHRQFGRVTPRLSCRPILPSY